jgi:hypothetical protein
LTHHEDPKEVLKFTTWLATEPYCLGEPELWLVCEYDWMIVMTLLGRVYRDVILAVETEKDSDPLYRESHFDLTHLDALNCSVADMTRILSEYLPV